VLDAVRVGERDEAGAEVWHGLIIGEGKAKDRLAIGPRFLWPPGEPIRARLPVARTGRGRKVTFRKDETGILKLIDNAVRGWIVWRTGTWGVIVALAIAALVPSRCQVQRVQ
jgi:hypothetical protein